MALFGSRSGKKFPRKGLVSAMTGQQPAFSPSGPVLPENYGFNDLAQYEEQRRNAFGENASNQIMGARGKLATSLSGQGQEFFKQNNPYILEDLNNRGLLSSPSTVNTAQADALKQIELGNQGILNQYDEAALNTNLQAQQDALDSGLDLRRGNLEQQFQSQQSAQEQALAEKLAKQQGRNSLYGSLIGAGGSLGAGLLAGRGGGGGGGGGGLFSGLLGGGGAAGIGGVANTSAGAMGASSSLFPGGLGTVGMPASGAGAAGGVPFLPIAAGIGGALALRNAVDKNTFGTTASGMLEPFFKPEQSIKKAAAIIKNPSAAIKKIKKWCFDPSTPIQMADGSTEKIDELCLGDETKGGYVESIRISIVPEGTLKDYKGVKVTESHAVYEDGKWIRVGESNHSLPSENDGTIISIITSNHKIYVKDILFSDEAETDNYENLTIDQSLDELNRQERVEVNLNGN